MQTMFGCAGAIALVAFFLGGIASLFATEANLYQKLFMALIPGVMAFVAAFLLFLRDHIRLRRTLRTVRNTLLSRKDVEDQDFCKYFPNIDYTLLTQTRKAISLFFDVPPQRIYPTDRLHDDLKVDALDPVFQFHVVGYILHVRNIIIPQPFTFTVANLIDIGDLANGIQRVLDKLEDRPGSSL